jgi:hypothetical protein
MIQNQDSPVGDTLEGSACSCQQTIVKGIAARFAGQLAVDRVLGSAPTAHRTQRCRVSRQFVFDDVDTALYGSPNRAASATASSPQRPAASSVSPLDLAGDLRNPDRVNDLVRMWHTRALRHRHIIRNPK